MMQAWTIGFFTMLKLTDSPNLEYKHLTAKVQDAV
jgi:hypothetical protein